MKGDMKEVFKIEKKAATKNGMLYDSKTTFFSDKDGSVEAEYFYSKGMVNYLLSWGFSKESLGELRKSKANKTKKPFFNLQKGWFS